MPLKDHDESLCPQCHQLCTVIEYKKIDNSLDRPIYECFHCVRQVEQEIGGVVQLVKTNQPFQWVEIRGQGKLEFIG